MRLITTRAELDALPDDSAIWSRTTDLDQAGAPHRKINTEWWSYAHDDFRPASDINLPAVVIEPEDFQQQ